VASALIFAWTAAASLAVAAAAAKLGVNPALPAAGVALLGFLVAERMRPRGPEWA
jgi:hypothetical protein